MKYLLLALLVLLFALPAAAQDDCNLDVSDVQALLSEAANADADTALNLVSDARAALELIEGHCLNYAPASAGDSRLNPVPFGQRQRVNFSDDVVVSVELIEYMNDAEEYVLSLYENNVPTPDGARYIAFRLKFICEVEVSASCKFYPLDFAAVGDKGVSYDYSSEDNYDINIYETDGSREIFGGSEIEVTVVFVVDGDDNNVVLYTEYGNPRVFFASQ